MNPSPPFCENVVNLTHFFRLKFLIILYEGSITYLFFQLRSRSASDEESISFFQFQMFPKFVQDIKLYSSDFLHRRKNLTSYRIQLKQQIRNRALRAATASVLSADEPSRGFLSNHSASCQIMNYNLKTVFKIEHII